MSIWSVVKDLLGYDKQYRGDIEEYSMLPPKQQKGQMNNQIKMLRPWRDKSGIWAFDDPTCGLRGESFVCNASLVIDKLVEINKAKIQEDGTIGLMFSHAPFPGSRPMFLVNDSKGGGVTYEMYVKGEKDPMEAWLCPAFYHYFEVDQVPSELYAMAV